MKKNRLFDQNQYFVTWVSWVVRYPMLAVAVFSLLTLVSATFTISNLSINTDTEDMLSSEDVATSIVNTILAKNNIVHEEVVIRRTAGDI